MSITSFLLAILFLYKITYTNFKIKMLKYPSIGQLYFRWSSACNKRRKHFVESIIFDRMEQASKYSINMEWLFQIHEEKTDLMKSILKIAENKKKDFIKQMPQKDLIKVENSFCRGFEKLIKSCLDNYFNDFSDDELIDVISKNFLKVRISSIISIILQELADKEKAKRYFIRIKIN